MQFSGTQFEISANGFSATLVQVGGGLRALSVNGIDVIDGYASDAMCPGGAGQLLMPWPNRIRDGKYRFGDVECQLDLSEPKTHNAIHGLARWARWHPVEQAADSVTLECDLVPTPGYPWLLRLRTRWSISASGLQAEHSATNLAEKPCPFGMGVHPYLIVPGVAVDDLVLRLPGRSRLLVDGRLLPIGAAKVAGSPFDFSEPRRIGTAVLDTAFGDVEHDSDGCSRAVLASLDGERSVEIWADSSYRWWQAFTGDTLPGERHRRSVALEPMTCPPDAFRSGRDLVTINPGQTWTGSWGISPRLGE
jgi:aldose 1-epimerase